MLERGPLRWMALAIELLAGAALALDENGEVGRDDAVEDREDLADGGRVPDDRGVVELVLVARLERPQLAAVALHLRVLLRDLAC